MEDVDAYGVVHHPNYLRYLERARLDFLVNRGISLRQMQEDGVIFVVHACELRFHQPAQLQDELTVVTRLEKMRKMSMIFQQEVTREADFLMTAQLRVACVDDTWRLVSLPMTLQERLC